MTSWFGTIALALALGGSAAFAQAPRLLKGKVYSLSASGEKVAEKKITVTFELTGNSDDTNDLGIFMLPLPPAYRASEPVKLAINKPGWRIPNDGNVRVPFDLEKDLAKVELVPSKPEEFWSEARVEDLIKTVAEKSVQQAPAKGEEEKIDFSRYIKDWAEKYGYSAQQAKEEIDKWIAEVEAAPNNDKQLGLAEFAKKNFGEAARHFEASATQKAALLAETRRQQQALAE